MIQGRRFAYRILTVLVALYGLASACVCTDHGAAQAATAACHRCAGHDTDTAGVQVSPHHQCCGMQRAPIAIERTPVPASSGLETIVVLPTVTTVPKSDIATIIVPAFSHGPPCHHPIYLTTQHFLI